MKLPRIMLYALLGTIAAVAIPVMAYMTIRFSPVLSAQEKEVLGFVNTPLSLHTRGWKTVSRACPVSPETEMTVMTNQRTTAVVRGIPYSRITAELPVVTFILHGESTHMAVIDGYVLKEGNSFEGWRVLRIEQKRVLLDNMKEKKWISVD